MKAVLEVSVLLGILSSFPLQQLFALKSSEHHSILQKSEQVMADRHKESSGGKPNKLLFRVLSHMECGDISKARIARRCPLNTPET